MNIVCLDMEGVLVPEIWIAFAEESGIPELRRTTRDEPDYDKLMRWRIDLLRQRGLKLSAIQETISRIDPLPGAKDFLDALRKDTQVVILSDTFDQFAMPLMAKLGYPTLLCNTLEVDGEGYITRHLMRCEHSKLTTVKALQSIGYDTIASGDSYNDLEMILHSKAGFLFRGPDKIKQDYPDLPAFEDYGDLLAAKQKIAYFRGLSALEKGDTQGAGRYLAESARIGISPKYNALATFWQGEIAYGRGNYDVALRDYESYLKRAPKTEPEYAMAFYNTGYCHFSKENMPRARESFVRFIELYPTQDGYRTDARNRLGDTYYSDRQFDEALKYYGQAAAASDDGADYARYQRAVTLGILGRTSEKIKALQQIIRDGRGDYLDDATYELGRTFVAQERYREGAAVLEHFVETYVYSPYRSAALSELGLAYLNLGDKKKSLSYYDMVVKTAPQSSDAKDALQGIRDIYVSEGDAGGYFDYARKSGVEGDLTAMSRDSLSFAAARRIYLSGEPASAAKSLRSYLESYPKGYYTADALYCLSDCYLKTGERSRAIETLAALAGAGQNQYTHRALKTLAGMTFADERFTEAAAAYRKLADAESTAAGKAEAMNGYVRATIAAGDEERILSMADDVASYTAAGDLAWRESQFAKAGILDRRGDAAAAQKIYKVLSANVKTSEGAESAYRVIESAFRAGDTARAEKLVLDFSDKGTPHAFWLAKSFLVLGDIYVQKGDMFQARATYQSIVDGYTPADDGIVAEAKEKIKKLN